ncbi:MAG: riboflavin synthase [Lawsonella sp.]
MFTGLVEEIGTVIDVTPNMGGSETTRLTIECSLVLEGTQLGDSIAVDGVCLTVVDYEKYAEKPGGFFYADVMGETLKLTTVGDWTAGRSVNLERAVAVGDRLGGHLVQGHVDTCGEITRISDDHVVRVALPHAAHRYVAYKGSITLNGISLTVSQVGDDWLEVSLIPETLERTTLGGAKVGDRINIEVDAIAKYVDHLLQPYK